MTLNKVSEELTATDVTDDLLNRRSASLNFLFLLSVLLLEFLLQRQKGWACSASGGQTVDMLIDSMTRQTVLNHFTDINHLITKHRFLIAEKYLT